MFERVRGIEARPVDLVRCLLYTSLFDGIAFSIGALQQGMSHQLSDRNAKGGRRILRQVAEKIFGTAPIAEKIQNFAGYRCGRRARAGGVILKDKCLGVPVGNQARRSPETNLLRSRHSEQSTIDCCRNGRWDSPWFRFEPLAERFRRVL